MPTRSLNVVVSGDARPLKATLTQAGEHAEKFGKKSEEASHRASEGFKRVHEASKLLLEIGGLSSLAFGLKDVTEEAVKAETEQKKLQATVKTAGLSWKAHGKEIDEWLDKTSLASGFVKSDLTNSLSNLIRVTGSVTQARKLESEAMDVSRARGTSLASAQQLLARVYAGSFTSLQRLGIPVKAVTTAQDKLRETTKHATVDQLAHAKALDKQASVTRALGLVQDKFGGQSKAFASSTAGSFERARASLNLFEEQIGKVILPVLAKAAGGIASLAESAQRHWPQIQATAKQVFGRLKPDIDAVSSAIGRTISTVRSLVNNFRAGKGPAVAIVSVIAGLSAGLLVATAAIKTVTAVTKLWRTAQIALDIVLNANPIGIVVTALAGLAVGLTIAYKRSTTFRNIVNGAWKDIRGVVIPVIHAIGDAVKTVFQDVMLPVIRRTVGAIKSIIGGLVDVIRGAVRVISGLLSGNWSKAWDGAKEAVRGAWRVMKTVVKTGIDNLTDLIRGVGPTLVRLILKGFAGFGKSLTDSIVSGIKSGARAIIGVAGWLKDTVVGAVKKAFGISSPSTVMLALGAHIASGLVHGITGSGIFKSILGGLGLGGGGADPSMKNAGKGGSARQWLMEALRITGQYTPSNYAALYRQMMSESGGNPRAINLWDSNAAAGHPSKGLLQTIDSTFQAHRLKSLPNDIWNPVANAVAAIRYMLAQYGHIVGTGHGYAAGTGGAARGWGWVGEKGPELVHFLGGEQVLSHGDSMGASGMPGYAQGTLAGRTFGRRARAVARRARGAPAKGRDVGKGSLSPEARQAIADNLANQPTAYDFLDAALAIAELTPDTADDRTALQNIANLRGTEYQSAVASGDPRKIAEAARNLKSATDALGSFQDTAKELVDALKDVKASIDAQTAFATSVSNTSNYQLTKMLTDIISGHIVGRGVAGRALTPGTGVEVAY